MPAIIGQAIDDGVAASDTGALLFWAGALLTAGIVRRPPGWRGTAGRSPTG
jgi:hypothetical protein